MPSLVTTSYVLLFAITVASHFVIVPIYLNLLVTAFCTVYIGCHASLKREEDTETMSAKDAWMFPIVGSGFLFGLYMLFRLLHKDYINLILSGYFVLLGAFVLEASFHPYIRKFFPKEQRMISFTIPHVPKMLHDKGEVHVKFGMSNVVSFTAACFLAGVYVKTKHWAANNLLGIAFSIQGIQNISLGSYKIGAILLCGLFLYDVFWVFGTDVMVTVAKNFDAPIKLLFVRSFATEDTDATHSMLGLGDIVIPGVFIALLLRYDAHRAGFNVLQSKSIPETFSKPYFNASVVGYTAGLFVTLFIMFTFEHAQPALLYLVPACLLCSLSVAIVLGDLRGLFSYTEETEEDGKDAKGKTE